MTDDAHGRGQKDFLPNKSLVTYIIIFQNFLTGYGGIPYGDRNDQIQLSTCSPVATAEEIDPDTLVSPKYGSTWTLPEAHEILIGPKNDPFCFVVFPGADSVRKK